jgi:hypothetical protein
LTVKTMVGLEDVRVRAPEGGETVKYGDATIV